MLNDTSWFYAPTVAGSRAYEMRYALVTPPAAEPVTLDEVREYLRVDSDDTSQDVTLAMLITAAWRYAESYTGRSFITQSWRAVADGFPGVCADPVILLRKGPVTAVTGITYVDQNGATQTLDPATYVLDTSDLVQRLAPAYGAQWPAARAQLASVQIAFTAGFGNAAAVPATVRNWILVRIASAFEHREHEEIAARGAVLAPSYVDGLLDSEKAWLL
jgi:uncharacterized phiE125 gp8 family phage protein